MVLSFPTDFALWSSYVGCVVCSFDFFCSSMESDVGCDECSCSNDLPNLPLLFIVLLFVDGTRECTEIIGRKRSGSNFLQFIIIFFGLQSILSRRTHCALYVRTNTLRWVRYSSLNLYHYHIASSILLFLWQQRTQCHNRHWSLWLWSGCCCCAVRQLWSPRRKLSPRHTSQSVAQRLLFSDKSMVP